jgi:hypothetical protein
VGPTIFAAGWVDQNGPIIRAQSTMSMPPVASLPRCFSGMAIGITFGIELLEPVREKSASPDQPMETTVATDTTRLRTLLTNLQ